mmetsp:Transcript_21230/g.49412  ORF Transcript_21230/g.49412 Transcript_21230/m.49412 type:complete len:238 (+) Transcript_21230:1009-1722(+)
MLTWSSTPAAMAWPTRGRAARTGATPAALARARARPRRQQMRALWTPTSGSRRLDFRMGVTRSWETIRTRSVTRTASPRVQSPMPRKRASGLRHRRRSSLPMRTLTLLRLPLRWMIAPWSRRQARRMPTPTFRPMVTSNVAGPTSSAVATTGMGPAAAVANASARSKSTRIGRPGCASLPRASGSVATRSLSRIRGSTRTQHRWALWSLQGRSPWRCLLCWQCSAHAVVWRWCSACA